MMEKFEFILLVLTSFLIASAAFHWSSRVNACVPEPYLDEFFHVHQAQLYLQGRWDAWNPKITTPPGLYLASYLWISPLQYLGLFAVTSVSAFRATNLYAAITPLVLEFRNILIIRTVRHGSEPDSAPNESKTVPPSQWSMAELYHALLNISLFPPLFFFYGLYYTDVISALLVLMAYRLDFAAESNIVEFLLVGLSSLFMRQTNIFWVSIFCGGLKICRTLPLGHSRVQFPQNPTVSDVVVKSWQHSYIYNPLVSEACFEGPCPTGSPGLSVADGKRLDYAKSAISIAIASIGSLRTTLRSLKLHILFLVSFGLFVLWNGGVVLGDKENHVASIHLPQMLYIWPYFMFFSLPLLYPYIANTFFPMSILPEFIRSCSTWHQFPRLVILIPIVSVALTIVQNNTFIHPFTLADNRHYMFYVFRLLLRHHLFKYVSIPIYILCAWAAITSLGGLPGEHGSNKQRQLQLAQNVAQSQAPQQAQRDTQQDVKYRAQRQAHPTPIPGNRVSFVLVWLLATSLSLVTAPLVEPRYFIIPWLVWRLQIPISCSQTVNSRPKLEEQVSAPSMTLSQMARSVLYEKHDHRLWLETAWFLAINWATGYIFLYWGFEWPQEPGKVQRLMW